MNLLLAVRGNNAAVHTRSLHSHAEDNRAVAMTSFCNLTQGCFSCTQAVIPRMWSAKPCRRIRPSPEPFNPTLRHL